MIGYLLLAAEEKGYATLTYTPSDTRWANSMFNVPEEYRLQTIIPIGKPDEAPSDPGRLPLKEIVFVEEWGNKLIQ
jgi:nitroreductase